jgi:ribulose-phosphate 3-epimerase
MIEIIPAILAKNYEDLKEKISYFKDISNFVQIDVCDGLFVPSISWPMQIQDEISINPILNEEEGLPYWEKINFEFDLMVTNAHKQFNFFMKLGAKRIIFHLEAEEEESLKEFLVSLDPYFKDEIEIGLAINTTTDIKKIDPFINYIDFIQCMGIEKVGFQGEPFDERVLEEIKNLKNKYPEVRISIDGGVNHNTAKLLVEAGADRLVIGSALLESDDLEKDYEKFRNL